MAAPWQSYGVPAPTPASDPSENDGDKPVTINPETGIEVTVTDDSPEAPVGELPAAAPTPVAGQPWSEYGLSGSPSGDEGLTGTVTDTGGPYTDEQGNLVDKDGHPLSAAPDELVGTPEAMWEGLKGGALMGFGDEIQGLGGGVGSWLGGRGFSSGYQQERDAARQRSDQAWDSNPWAYGVGYVPGTLMSMIATRGRGRFAAPEGAGLMTRMGYGAGGGAFQGAVTGAGHADDGAADTLFGAGLGGALGAPLGALAVPLGDLITNVGGRAVRAVMPRGNNLNSGLDVLAQRAPQDAAAMRQGTGRLVDRVDESGRGVIRDAASKMTPGREAVARHADQVYAGAQDRVADVARREIAPEVQTARQLERQVRGDKNLGGDDEAGVLMGDAMEPLRGRTIAIDDGLKEVLGTREGQAALRAAEGLMTDPEERAAARRLLSAARQYAKGPADPEDAFRAEIKGWDDLPEPVKAGYRAQRPDLMEAADPFKDTPLTLDMADKFARAMKGRAAKTPGLERVSRQFANSVRDAAKAQVPEYGKALEEYGQRMGVADAASGSGKFEDSKFLQTPADLYGDTVAQASPVPAAIDAPDTTPGLVPTVSERDALRRRARDEVVDQATSGAGQHAGATARQIAFGGGESGVGQASRNRALLGEDQATRLEQGMENEVNRVRNTEFIDARRGSKTQSASQDAIVDGFIGAVANTASSGRWAPIHLAAKWLKQGGIRGVDAERLARDAISEDPARINAAIDYLEQKGMARNRASRFVDAFASSLAGRAAGKTQEGPPSSARSLYKTPTEGASNAAD